MCGLIASLDQYIEWLLQKKTYKKQSIQNRFNTSIIRLGTHIVGWTHEQGEILQFICGAEGPNSRAPCKG